MTQADRDSERCIVERLSEAFPDHGILAEESGQVAHGGTTWIVDPLDGTTNFAHGFPHFAVVLALFDGSTGLVGVVHDPIRDETFHAALGGGATLSSPRGERALAVSRLSPEARDLERSLLATGFAYDRATASKNNIEEFNRLIRRVRGIRRAGSAALDMAYVAAGRLDGYWEYNLSPWDWAAGAVLVREAGGRARTMNGEDWKPGDLEMICGEHALCDRLSRALATPATPTTGC